MTALPLVGRLRDHLFRSALYHLTLRARPVMPHTALPILFAGDAELGRALRVGDLIKTLRAMEQPPIGGDLDTGPTAHVQRFNWLADLAASGLETAATVARELTALWVDEHARWSATSWATDVLAERLGNWMLHAPFLLDGSDEIFRDAFLTSLHRQARHLHRAGVIGVPPHDGFAEARAEIFYGLIFEEQTHRLDASLISLARRIEDEVLADGGHRLRNPSRHLAALRNLIEVRAALAMSGQGVPAWLQTAVDRMAPMLRTFRHGDGGLCLFNGSGSVTREEVDWALHMADAKGRAVANASHSGFQRLTAGQAVVILDTGVTDPVGAGESAGTLAFEFSAGRRRIIVNCGTPILASSPLREVCRGSAAHSTLILEGTNSSELLGVSAMGDRRAHRTDSTRHEVDKNILVESEHDGYLPLFGLSHRRALYLSADGLDLRGEDTLIGSRPAAGVLRFHLHPDVGASLVEGGRSVLLRIGKTQGWRFQVSETGVHLEDSVYFGEGPRRQCQQIVVPFEHGPAPTTVKWRFHQGR